MSEAVDPALEAEVRDFEARLETADHFSLLGVEKGASALEVKRAFYQLSRRLHEEIAEFDKWFTPREVRFEYDSTRSWLVLQEEPDEPDSEIDVLLLPKDAGRFAPGYMFRGELGFLQKGSEWAFTFNEEGVAVSLETRDTKDQVDGRAERLAP
jgi:hypothetical protein